MRTVTFVSHTNAPGGAELALRRYLEATEIPVRLVTLQDGGVWEGMDAETVAVGGLAGLRRTLRREHLVVANSMRAAFLTSLVLPREVRQVYWVRDGLTESAMSPTALFLTRHITRRRTGLYLANSRWTARTIEQAMKVGAERIHVVHSLSGLGEASTTDQAAPRTPHSPVRMLYLGRIASWKGPDLAVQCVRHLRDQGVDATLTIVGGAHFGEGAYRKRLETQVAGLPGVRMTGHVDDVPSVLASHDLLLHTSRRPEPFGQVIVQALAAGLPVVAPDAGGPAEILTHSPVPCLYPTGDVAAMAMRTREVLANHADVSRWAVERSLKYSDERLTAEMDETMRQLDLEPAKGQV
ncbi:glycosyltransferase [Ornithinimicrobium cerasi]|uniref:D-inositol 3-phosphate glycosyltransferase n=1 Tax=Ornithinimicrobium cerasi TaxID=2248773 RepID=A0A285VX29_9MICO|nr:glycosyltransferase [Ornithinimicrobium cerasi]SOC57806.1 Glycosyl transferases group 1 [Ornithinimicrobium cerasi]